MEKQKIDMSISRLHGASCMLHGLCGGAFENDITGLLEKNTVSFSGIPKAYINAFDWVNAYYETIQYMIEELSYMIEEQAIAIEVNINDRT